MYEPMSGEAVLPFHCGGDLDAPRKNATAKSRRTKESQLDKIPEYMRKGTYSRNRALCPALLRETMAWKTRRDGQLSDFFR